MRPAATLHAETVASANAAAYAEGIAETPAFIDGSKRTTFMIGLTVPRLNGLAVRPDPVEGVRMMESLAAGAVSEAAFAAWRKRHSTPHA